MAFPKIASNSNMLKYFTSQQSIEHDTITAIRHDYELVLFGKMASQTFFFSEVQIFSTSELASTITVCYIQLLRHLSPGLNNEKSKEIATYAANLPCPRNHHT